MQVLLVEPAYYSRYPPLGLMKIAAYHRVLADDVRLVRGLADIRDFKPSRIEITSLFTYAWKPVHQAIEFYHEKFPEARIGVGGIYASLMPEDILKDHPYVNIHVGLNTEAERYMPDYDILKQVDRWKDWDGSILFTSRGCVNRCPFCMVPVMEGGLRNVLSDPRSHVHPEHSRVIVWDNNFLALPDWKEKMELLRQTGKYIDFNQGLDARQMTREKAEMLASLKTKGIRMAYDGEHEKEAAHRAADLLENAGFGRREISFYALYNFYDYECSFYDTPDEFYRRILDIMHMGCVSYPMRFVDFHSKSKNGFVSVMWSEERLEAVAKARRVLGFGGAFPPYEGLVKKFEQAGSFDEAFRLEPKKAGETGTEVTGAVADG
ncbi:MAG: hypothetical protein PHT00_03460 [Candidatus Methanomethylophilus sp.]|nr:hypothetical protein [Methanomethylophilus sp.]